MSDIKVGDLVIVVKPMPCCGAATGMMGHIFRVSGFKPPERMFRCLSCQAPEELDKAIGGIRPIDIVRLKRIPPLSELESEKDKKEIAA